MTELLKVYFLSSNTRTCFFYRNESDLRDQKLSNFFIKIQYGKNKEKQTYGSISQQPFLEVPNKCIGITPLLGNRLGIKENEEVLISPCSVSVIGSLQIFPRKTDDYVILLSCKSILESHLLNQVVVVAEGQILPLYIFSNIVIDVEIGKLQSGFEYGQIGQFTEVTVLYPKQEKLLKPLTNENQEISDNCDESLMKYFNRILEKINLLKIDEKQIQNEIVLKSLFEINEVKLEYKIKPSFLLKNIPKKTQDKYIIVSNFESDEVNFGPCCLKVFSKINKVDLMKDNDNQKNISDEDHKKVDNEKEKENISLYNFVISLNESKNNIAFCPPHVMKKLKLFAGSRITIEKVKTDSKLFMPNFTEVVEDCEHFFWNSFLAIKENIKQTIMKNAEFNYKINILLLGESGSGKTFLLNDLMKKLADDFIYCKLINCKSLRGKKIETLQKLWVDCLKECCCYEPAVLICDDLHVMTYIDEEDEEHYNKLYSNRVVDLVTECLENFQKKFNICVIASSVNMPKLSSFVTVRGPRLFQNIHIIPEMNPSERDAAIRHLVKVKTKNEIDSLDFDKICNKTKGYAIQDLSDLVDKAIFNFLIRNEDTSDKGSLSSVGQEDFDSVLSESTPLILRGVKLKENVETKWENIGGMLEPKRILLEMFSWPVKYPKLLESCPLRLQKGVLLYGAPGTGKTLLAGALAGKCGLNFISVKGPEVLSKYVGASEEGIRNLFIQAQKTQPCLLFFDEFESLATRRGLNNTGVTDRVVNQLLTQLDGVESLNGVWVLAASSRPDLLDPALLRPGRFDKMVFCSFPNQEDRLSIFEVLSKNLPLDEDINLSEISAKTEGYTGADIQGILCAAQMAVIKENKENLKKEIKLKVHQHHLLEAFAETKPSISDLEKIKYEKIYEKFLNSRKRSAAPDFNEMQKVTLA